MNNQEHIFQNYGPMGTSDPDPEPDRPEQKTEETTFREYAILELFGHRRVAGMVSECQLAGGSFIRIDIPGKDGMKATQYYSPSAIYCLTPTTEEIARMVAEQHEPTPVYRWELPQIERGKGSDPEDGFFDNENK